MSYRSDIVFYIASPHESHFKEILKTILLIAYQEESLLLNCIMENGQTKILRKEEYDKLKSDEYVLTCIQSRLSINEEAASTLTDVAEHLNFHNNQFNMEYIELGDEFSDVVTFDYNTIDSEYLNNNDHSKSFLIRNTLTISRVIDCNNDILDEMI